MAILWPNGLTTPPAVSSGFGPRGSGPYGDASTFHKGTDFIGFDVVHSIAAGTVVYVGWNGGVGWSTVAGFMVWVQHDGFFSRYLHTAAGTQRVSVGDRVTAGQALVDMGYSGLFDNAGNPAPWRKHTHVEIAPGTWNRSNVGQVDPYAWLSEHVGGETTTGAGGTAAPAENEEEWLMAAADDIAWIKSRVGGSIKNGSTVTDEIRALETKIDSQAADIAWLKDQVGGSSSRKTSLRQDVDKLLKG